MSKPGQTAMQNAQNLCDYCHIKPKFGQYNYCSKTCAAQAPSKVNAPAPNVKPTKPRAPPTANNLCDFCKKAPKHPGYDFCGKSCAQSSSAPMKPNNSGGKAQISTIAQAAAAALAGNNTSAAIDPTQIANLVVQQLQTLLPPAHSVYPNSTNHISSKTSGVSFSTKQPFQPTLNGTTQPTLRVQTQQPEPEETTECLIPGCGQPVYVDARGTKPSAYCSMRHRQEAVDSGLASPCIFCLQLPQSEMDYFCSKECREESLNKENAADTERPVKKAWKPVKESTTSF
ncbi:hypothetical protein GGU11DRAFT_383627 [Lentinula aff. detonsa]|nr:hypothetical protein GGU11DRAFT_383627 [Lentinula aff. detonsa]